MLSPPATKRLSHPLFSPALLSLAGLLACLIAMGAALYMQHGMHLEPCPLCIFQRVAMIATGLGFGLALLCSRSRLLVRISAVLTLLCASGGALIAGRHVWLQHLPADEVPACGPGLDYLVEVFPLAEVLEMVLSGSGECAEIAGTFLTLSIPEWTLVAFIGLGAWSILIFLSATFRSHP